MKSFERRMLEEKGLMNETLQFEQEGLHHEMPVEMVVDFIEEAPHETRQKIHDTLSEIDYKNGDVMHYIQFLGEAMAKL